MQVNHKPLAELHQALRAAGSQVEVGARYAHYKSPDHPYRVTGFAILEATDEVAVLYEVQEADQRVVFARPLSSWLETVEWQGRTVPRFARVS